jgi:aspartate carbamoyltransferase regulatory subunit
MHALPYSEEAGLSDFHPKVLEDKRVIIYEQAGFGVPCRLELITRSLKAINQRSATFEPSPIALDKVVEEPLAGYLEKRQSRRGNDRNNEHFRPIGNGTVIDHIPPELSQRIAFALKRDGLLSEGVKGILWDVGSKDMGKKEIFLMEGIHLPENIMLGIGAIAPSVTFNIIKNGIFTKLRVKDGSRIEGVGVCPNKACVTNVEPEASSRFIHEKGMIRCHYCEKFFSSHEIMA